jgi:hypothetical protein
MRDASGRPALRQWNCGEQGGTPQPTPNSKRKRYRRQAHFIWGSSRKHLRRDHEGVSRSEYRKICGSPLLDFAFIRQCRASESLITLLRCSRSSRTYQISAASSSYFTASLPCRTWHVIQHRFYVFINFNLHCPFLLFSNKFQQ